MELLTVTQYARRHNISAQAVYKKIKSGKLATKRVTVKQVRIIDDTPPPGVN